MLSRRQVSSSFVTPSKLIQPLSSPAMTRVRVEGTSLMVPRRVMRRRPPGSLKLSPVKVKPSVWKVPLLLR
jgi:hypothetical protein